MSVSVEECTICLEPMKDKASISCVHTFCFQCILDWSKITNLCPICKTEFRKIDQIVAPDEPQEAGLGRPAKRKGTQGGKKPKKAKSVKVSKRVQHVAYEDTGFANPNVLNNHNRHLFDSDDSDSDSDEGMFGDDFGFMRLFGLMTDAMAQVGGRNFVFRPRLPPPRRVVTSVSTRRERERRNEALQQYRRAEPAFVELPEDFEEPELEMESEEGEGRFWCTNCGCYHDDDEDNGESVTTNRARRQNVAVARRATGVIMIDSDVDEQSRGRHAAKRAGKTIEPSEVIDLLSDGDDAPSSSSAAVEVQPSFSKDFLEAPMLTGEASSGSSSSSSSSSTTRSDVLADLPELRRAPSLLPPAPLPVAVTSMNSAPARRVGPRLGNPRPRGTVIIPTPPRRSQNTRELSTRLRNIINRS